MKTYTRKELKEVLAQHALRLRTNGAEGIPADLGEANLSGVYLSGVYLSGANLFGANLTEANLCRADLSGAYMSGANLRDADLTGTDLRGADLTGADLNEAILTGANLTGADLTKADLRGADLTKADLTGADLSGCIGDMLYVKSMQLEGWPVAYTATHVQIGCQLHEIGQWWAFTDAEISAMDERALQWWAEWKPLLQMIIEASPALPTGDSE